MLSDDFLTYVLEDVLGGVSKIKARRMFGGFGLYHDGAFFGIVDDGQVFFKVDDRTRSEYEAAGSAPFSYKRRDKSITIETYYEVPADVLEDQKKAAAWARRAYRITKKQTRR